MAFDDAGWVCYAHGAGSSKIFHYKTNDLLTAVDDSGYFNSVYTQLSLGDMIFASTDLDGTPLCGVLMVDSATGATTVTTVVQSAVTLNLVAPIHKDVSMPAIGTAETLYVHAGVPAGFEGTVTRVTGVSDTSGAGSGGTSTITVTVPTTGAIATLPFLQDYTAGALIEDSSITAHVALDDDGVITIATDGTGSHTGAAVVSIDIDVVAA